MPRDLPRAAKAFCVAAACLAMAACARVDARPERVVVYINDNSDAAKRLLTALSWNLERELSTRYRLVVRHLIVDMRDANGMRAPIAAAIASRPSAIIATNSETAAIAKAMTQDIPVVFGSRQDPVRLGLVKSLARPGGNLTGFTYYVPIDPKRFELLRDVAPNARRLGIIVDRWWLEESAGEDVLGAARELGFEPLTFLAETPGDLVRVMASAQARLVDAWYVPYTVLPFDNAADVVGILETSNKPVVYPSTSFVERGGLMSYQQLLPLDESSRLIARMVALVLEGVSPSEIPIERPKSFALALNLAKARRLGIALPPGLIKRADRIVQDVH